MSLGGLDTNLANVKTSDLLKCAAEASAKIRQLESDADADVEAIEPMKHRLKRVVVDIKRRDYWRNQLSGIPFPTPEQIKTIAVEMCFIDIPEAVRVRLAELVAAWKRDGEHILKFCPAQATKDWQAHQNNLAELAASGGDVAGHEHKTLDAHHESYRSKLNVLRSAQMRHTTEARELAAPFIEQFQSEVAEVAAIRETNERDNAEKFKIPFEPSAVLRLLKRTQLALQDGEIPNGSSPDEIAAFIIN
jgi:hypothetical protein